MSSRHVGLLAAVVLVALAGSAAALLAADAPPNACRGKVVSVDTDKGTFVVAPRNDDNVTIVTDKDTKVTVDGKDATLAHVKAEMMVEVTPATGTAKTVTARIQGLHGKVVSVDADKGTMVLTPREGDNVTVVTDKDTKVMVDGQDATLAAVKADMMVEVTPASGTAKMIMARTEGLLGKVVSVDTDKGTMVVAPRKGDNVTVVTDKDTKVKLDGKEATPTEVKADMYVEVTPATGTAKTISARTPKAK